MTKGYVSVVLHTHLPFTRHPDANDALEERWLFEAMHECYLPLIEIYDNLLKDKVNFKITMSITPPIMTMLEDEYLNNRFLEHLKSLIKLSEQEIIRNKAHKELLELGHFYLNRFKNQLRIYKSYDNNLMNAFRKFDRLGCLEIITCSATHAFLPLFVTHPESIKAQLITGIQTYYNCLGHYPAGIWLPECAYYYNLDPMLRDLGIKYFISENKAVLNASPRPQYGSYTPISTPSGVCAFPRDLESSQQVWSNIMGYPGDYNYREFYKDIGYELPMDYIEPYINKDGIRIDTGIKYHRITGKTDDKHLYNRYNAVCTAKNHGEHFAYSRNEQINNLAPHMDRPPIIICPYDTELFGHWWFEGPEFLDAFIRRSALEDNSYTLATPLQYLKENPKVQVSTPSPSSWGADSDYSVWLNDLTHWIYKDLHSCQDAMVRLATDYSEVNELQKRVLNQAARELMLAESSDWPFIISHHTTVAYAIGRVNKHISNFNKLYEMITLNKIDEVWLKGLEDINNIFPEIDYKIYKKDA